MGAGRRAGGNELPPLARVLLGDQAADLGVAEAGIPEVVDAILEGELLGLNHGVNNLGLRHFFERIILDDIEHLEHQKALRNRRLLKQPVAPVSGGQRLEPLRMFSMEIFLGQDPALFLDRRAQARAQFPSVKDIASLFCDLLQRARQIPLHDHLAGTYISERLAIASIHVGVSAADFFDPCGQPAVERKSVPGERDGVGGEPPEFQAGESPVQLHPTVDRPGHRDAERSIAGDPGKTLLTKKIYGGLFRRWSAGIQRLDLIALSHVHQGEEISARPRCLRSHHRQGERSRQRRVHRVAAVLEDPDAGQGGQVMARRDHAVASHDHGSCRCAEVHAGPNPKIAAALPPRICAFSSFPRASSSTAFKLFLTNRQPSSGP